MNKGREAITGKYPNNGSIGKALRDAFYQAVAQIASTGSLHLYRSKTIHFKLHEVDNMMSD
jgi:hypothetical protein